MIPPPSTLLTVTNVGPRPTGSNPRGPNRSDCRGNHRDSHRGSHRRESRPGTTSLATAADGFAICAVVGSAAAVGAAAMASAAAPAAKTGVMWVSIIRIVALS